MIPGILGKKLAMSQGWTDKGQRIPLTVIEAGPCPVLQIKTQAQDGYWAIQLGFGEKKEKNVKKALSGHFQKASLKKWPRFLREIRVENKPKLKVGDQIRVADVFQAGDQVAITGTSKGLGFTGVMKRWGFKGGPRTHGQSDRQRAPGSIGQTTYPGRVWKGKKMPGRAGSATITVKNLQVIEVDEKNNRLKVKGAVPGKRGGLLVIKKE